jgi:hypothetical protein
MVPIPIDAKNIKDEKWKKGIAANAITRDFPRITSAKRRQVKAIFCLSAGTSSIRI